MKGTGGDGQWYRSQGPYPAPAKGEKMADDKEVSTSDYDRGVMKAYSDLARVMSELKLQTDALQQDAQDLIATARFWRRSCHWLMFLL